MLLGTVAKRELRKVTLKVVVTTYGAILGHDEHLLILGPTKASDGTMLPRDAPDELASTAVYVYARF